MSKEKKQPRYYVKHHHLHPQNSTKQQRQNSKYATVATVIDSTNSAVIGTGLARCNSCDDIDKKVGALLARERALLMALNSNV